MTAQDQTKLLTTVAEALRRQGFRAGIDPLNRPLLILRDTEGNEWWLTATQVGRTALLDAEKSGEKPQIKNHTENDKQGELF